VHHRHRVLDADALLAAGLAVFVGPGQAGQDQRLVDPAGAAAIDMANNTEYGLTGGVISRDLNAALDVVSHVRPGIIHVNDQGIADEPMAPSVA
jgi:Aldehyde dehydrogenase family